MRPLVRIKQKAVIATDGEVADALFCLHCHSVITTPGALVCPKCLHKVEEAPTELRFRLERIHECVAPHIAASFETKPVSEYPPIISTVINAHRRLQRFFYRIFDTVDHVAEESLEIGRANLSVVNSMQVRSKQFGATLNRIANYEKPDGSDKSRAFVDQSDRWETLILVVLFLTGLLMLLVTVVVVGWQFHVFTR